MEQQIGFGRFLFMASVKRQGIFNLLIAYSGVLLAFFNTIFKARVLSTEEIGVISILTTISVLAGFAVNFGLNSIISKYYYKLKDDDGKKAALNSMVFLATIFNFVFIALILFFKKDAILAQYDNTLITHYYNLVFIIIFAESINKVWVSIFLVEFKSVLCNIIYDFVYKFSNFLILLFIFFSFISFNTFIILYACLFILRTILFVFFHYSVHKLLKPDFSIVIKKNILISLNYSFFMFFGGLAGILTKTIDKLMLGSMLSVESAGIYTIVITFPILIQTVGSAFSLTANAQISKLWQIGDIDSIRNLYRENAGIQMFLGFFLFGTFSIFGRELLSFIGEEYLIAYYAFILLMIGELANVSAGVCAGIIMYSSFFRYDLYVRIFLIFITVSTNMIFIPIWGLNGAAFATSLSLTLYNVMKITIVKMKIGLFPYGVETIKVLISSSLFFTIIYFSQTILKLHNILTVIAFAFISFIIYVFLNKYILKFSFLADLKHYIRK